MRLRAVALCLLPVAWADAPPDSFWNGVGAKHQLSGGCLPPGGTTNQDRWLKPIKLLALPTALEQTYVMAILLKERLGHPVELINPLGSDAPPGAIMNVMRGCPSESGATIEGSVCESFGTPDMAPEVMDIQISSFYQMKMGLEAAYLGKPGVPVPSQPSPLFLSTCRGVQAGMCGRCLQYHRRHPRPQLDSSTDWVLHHRRRTSWTCDV